MAEQCADVTLHVAGLDISSGDVAAILPLSVLAWVVVGAATSLEAASVSLQRASKGMVLLA